MRACVQVRIIVSGNGSHRYVDCVPVAAGKEKALQYVRQQFGVPEHLCVAAGARAAHGARPCMPQANTGMAGFTF